MEELGMAGMTGLLGKMIARHRGDLIADNKLWDAVGDAYSAAGEHAKALKWMTGWKTREGLTQYHILTVTNANWHLKQPHQAMKAHCYAINNLRWTVPPTLTSR